MLILYGGAGETHELALSGCLENPAVVQESDVTIGRKGPI